MDKNDFENIFKDMCSKDFGYYLAGLFEGDGHIIVPNKYNLKKYKKQNPSFCITMQKKNEFLCKSLINKLNYGWIRKKVRENAVVFTITNEKGFVVLLNILEGKLKRAIGALLVFDLTSESSF